MLLLNANPRGGRPLDNVNFVLDQEDSKMAWRIGYIQCQCGLAHPISISNEDLDKFINKCHTTLIKVRNHKITDIMGKWLRKVADRVDHTKNPVKLPNEVYITR